MVTRACDAGGCARPMRGPMAGPRENGTIPVFSTLRRGSGRAASVGVELQRGVLLDEFRQSGPALGIQRLEGVEVHGEQRRLVASAQGVDDANEIGFGRGGGEDFNGAVFVVGDAESVEEFAEEVFVGAYEPQLEDVSRGVVMEALGDLFDKPSVLLGARFFLDENGAEFPGLSERLDSGLVEGLLVFVQKSEDALRHGGGHFGKNLVGLKHTWKEARLKALRKSGSGNSKKSVTRT